MSLVLGDRRGLPPLLIEVASHEILLSGALRLAAGLDEGDAALGRAAVFVKNQLAGTRPSRAGGSADPISETPMFELAEPGGAFVAVVHELGIPSKSAG